MRILIIVVVFFFCFFFDFSTRLDKAPVREIVVYAALMLVSMIIPIYVYTKGIDVPSPNYAIEKVIDFFVHINE